MIPRTRYCRCGDINIAYQVVGDGDLDIVLVPGWVSNIDVLWEEPRLARFLQRLASFSRLILFDKRGTGLSDRVTDTPTLEERMEDVRGVMLAVGSERAALVGYSEGGPMCALFAATYPQIAQAVVMIGSFPRRIACSDFPHGTTQEEAESFIDAIVDEWGTDFALDDRAPSVADDPSFRQWWARFLRMSASPATAQALTRANMDIDIRDVLESIKVPTLLIHATGDRTVDVGCSRYMAKRIPGAKLVEIDSNDHLPWLDGSQEILEAIERFLLGAPAPKPDNRVLSTLLFTDIVGSTGTLSASGDEAWGDLLAKHNACVRREFGVFSGREIKATGDGFLAAFDGPARAVRCAEAIRSATKELGISVRQGLHTGECAFTGNDVSGLAVHLAARIADLTQQDEILVSRTVRDLVAGSGLKFEHAGSHSLKGIDEEWHLYRVV